MHRLEAMASSVFAGRVARGGGGVRGTWQDMESLEPRVLLSGDTGLVTIHVDEPEPTALHLLPQAYASVGQSGVQYGDVTDVFDGDTSTYCQGRQNQNDYVWIDLGAGNASQITKFQFYPQGHRI
jgi:hypothetical protein